MQKMTPKTLCWELNCLQLPHLVLSPAPTPCTASCSHTLYCLLLPHLQVKLLPEIISWIEMQASQPGNPLYNAVDFDLGLGVIGHSRGAKLAALMLAGESHFSFLQSFLISLSFFTESIMISIWDMIPHFSLSHYSLSHYSLSH